MKFNEVPSPVDFRLMRDALEWERKAVQRPYREEFFAAICNELNRPGDRASTVLDIGSGPGFLAAHILATLPSTKLTLLDFSPAMHALARKRLIAFHHRVDFVERNFKEPGWWTGLETFDAVVTLQAVHELRHKSYATRFHRQVRNLLKSRGQYLVCDHYLGRDAMNNHRLYMTVDEQRESLEKAGYAVREILVKGGRVLFSAGTLR